MHLPIPGKQQRDARQLFLVPCLSLRSRATLNSATLPDNRFRIAARHVLVNARKVSVLHRSCRQGMLWNGMEWKMVWNGWRILVWNMEDAQKRNGRFEKWNGRSFSILTTYAAYIKTYNKLRSTTKLERG